MLAFSSHIDEIASHLRAILVQTIPSDDQIIIGHVREALATAQAVQRELIAAKQEAA